MSFKQIFYNVYQQLKIVYNSKVLAKNIEYACGKKTIN